MYRRNCLLSIAPYQKTFQLSRYGCYKQIWCCLYCYMLTVNTWHDITPCVIHIKFLAFKKFFIQSKRKTDSILRRQTEEGMCKQHFRLSRLVSQWHPVKAWEKDKVEWYWLPYQQCPYWFCFVIETSHQPIHHGAVELFFVEEDSK